MTSDGHKQIENQYFNWKDKSCLLAIAMSNNKVRRRSKDYHILTKFIGEICNV